MPYREKEITKLYFSIGEVAEMFSVSPSLIRYWEGEFDNLNPRKNKKGNRLFTKEDIEELRKIYTLVKEGGHTLEGAKKKLKTKEGRKEDVLIKKLEGIKKKLTAIKKLITQEHTLSNHHDA